VIACKFWIRIDFNPDPDPQPCLRGRITIDAITVSGRKNDTIRSDLYPMGFYSEKMYGTELILILPRLQQEDM
jgi:hypothetical protein